MYESTDTILRMRIHNIVSPAENDKSIFRSIYFCNKRIIINFSLSSRPLSLVSALSIFVFYFFCQYRQGYIRIQIVPKRNSVWNKRIKIRVSTSKGTVQNNIMKCMVSKRSAWSKDAIIKITQFVDDLIQETEPGFICGLKKRDNYYYSCL